MNSVCRQEPPRVALVVKTLSDNSLGRAYSLSLVLDEVGADWAVLSVNGGEIWSPVRDMPFARRCEKVDSKQLGQVLTGFDSVIALKPLPETFGLCQEVLSSKGPPLVVDIDDPDLEARLSWKRPLKQMRTEMLHPLQMKRLRDCAKKIGAFPRIVSNPFLAEKYGGVVIPHVRPALSLEPTTQRPAIPNFAWIGTPRNHKGIRTIRQAFRQLNRSGTRAVLTITAEPPNKPYSWEKWVGEISLTEGWRLLRDSDATIITLWKEPFKSLQLPAKAVDALVSGTTVIRNSSPTLDWIFGKDGILLSGPSSQALTECLSEMTVARPQRHCWAPDLIELTSPKSFADRLRQVLALHLTC